MTARGTVRVGVAGAGGWGKNVVRACAQAGVLAAVCDTEAATLAMHAGDYPGVATTTDYGNLLGMRLDAILIATPAKTHAAMALAALDAGKHVFVEKPFALTEHEASSIVARANARGLRSFAGHLLLYHPAIREALRRTVEGSIGAVRHIRSRRLGFGRLRDFENVWWSFAPHDVAVMLAVAGRMPAACTSSAVHVAESVLADFCYADYTFDDGLTAHVEVGWLDPQRSHRLDIVGTGGTITFDDSRDGASLTLDLLKITAGGMRGREAKSSGPMRIPFADVEPLRAEIDAFVQSIESGAQARTGGESAVEVTAALAMAQACALPQVAVLA